MKTKLVIWGNNEEDKRILLALELDPDKNKVNIHSYPDTIATDEFSDKLMAEWRNKKDAVLPEGYSLIERDLSMTEDLLPENLKTERGDLIQRAKTEWAFIVLSSKLNEAYQTELKDIKERIGGLSTYDSEAWNRLKEFWTKVEVQVREKNLFREHASALKDGVNDLFSRLKELRTTLDNEFNKLSSENFTRFNGLFDNIEGRIGENKNLQSLFNELKDVQKEYKDTKFTREHRKAIWDRLDGAFKSIKEKRFGPEFDKESSPVARLDRRYKGLITAIGKMERSINRDKDELAFQNRKIATTDGQLEAQIRQAKIKMIEGYISSKEEKLGDMMKTKQMLDDKRVVHQKNEEKRAERDKHDAAKIAAKEKIAAQISQQQNDIAPDEKSKLSTAANAIVGDKTPSNKNGEEKKNEQSNNGTSNQGNPEIPKVEGTKTEVTTGAAVNGVSNESTNEVKSEAAEVEGTKTEATTGAVNGISNGSTNEVNSETTGTVKEEKSKVAADENTSESSDDKSDTINEAAGNVAKFLGGAAIVTPVVNKVANGIGGAAESKVGTQEDSLLEAISNTMAEVLEDVVTTAKAVAIVVGERLEDTIEEVTEQIEQVVNNSTSNGKSSGEEE